MDGTSTQQRPTPAYVIARNGTIYSPDVDGAYRNGNGDQLHEQVQQMILAGNPHPDYDARNDDGSAYGKAVFGREPEEFSEHFYGVHY